MSAEDRPEEPEPAEPETPQTSVYEQTVRPVPDETAEDGEGS